MANCVALSEELPAREELCGNCATTDYFDRKGQATESNRGYKAHGRSTVADPDGLGLFRLTDSIALATFIKSSSFL